jgi:hypothetical protein
MVVVAGDYLDDVFCQALASEAEATGQRVGQAVMALVLERPLLRQPPPGTVELFGYSEQNTVPGACVSCSDLRDPSGVMTVARAWLGAQDANGHTWYVDSNSISGLSFLGGVGERG